MRLAAAVLTFAIAGAAWPASAQTAENVAVVINDASAESKEIGSHYVEARSIPAGNVIHIETSTDDAVPPLVFLRTIQQPIETALRKAQLQDRILYIVLTKGIPLRIAGTAGQDGTTASVDSELTLLYRRMAGAAVQARGRIDNPYYLDKKPIAEAKPFTRRDHDIYLVSRLDAFTVEEAKALVDRAARTTREGQVVLDQRDALVNRMGEDWLGLAAQHLTQAGHGERVVLETTPKPARDVSPVLGYFSWGSTDPQNRTRSYKMDFVPGAIAATFVSTDARTFKEPPAAWRPTNTTDPRTWFAGTSQSLLGDLIREGVTGAAGQVSEPYLQSAVRPDVLFPAYVSGFNLVEAFYLAIPHLSWQTVVIGDPLCSPFARRPVARNDIDRGIDPELDLPAYFGERRVANMAASLRGAPEKAARLAVRADVALMAGDRPTARRLLEQASELAPEAAPLHTLLADFHVAAGEMSLAAERYEKVIALEPRNVIALNNLAYDLAVRQKKLDEAQTLARRAIGLAKNEAVVLDTLGWIEYLRGNTAEATRFLLQAAKGAPRNPDIRLHAAIALAAQGARAAAAAELDEALKLNPSLESSPEVAELRARLNPATK